MTSPGERRATDRAVVFDIETVPDLDVARHLFGAGTDIPDAEVRRRLGEHSLRGPGDPSTCFVRLPFHRILCLAALVAERATQDGPWTLTALGCLHVGQVAEAEILHRFVGSLARRDGERRGPTLVGFNTALTQHLCHQPPFGSR